MSKAISRLFVLVFFVVFACRVHALPPTPVQLDAKMVELIKDVAMRMQVQDSFTQSLAAQTTRALKEEALKPKLLELRTQIKESLSGVYQAGREAVANEGNAVVEKIKNNEGIMQIVDELIGLAIKTSLDQQVSEPVNLVSYPLNKLIEELHQPGWTVALKNFFSQGDEALESYRTAAIQALNDTRNVEGGLVSLPEEAVKWVDAALKYLKANSF